MARKPVIAFLIKIFPVFLVLLLLWHTAGGAHVYHRFISAVLDWTYPALDPVGVVAGVRAEGREFALRLELGGKSAGLRINGEDITSNTAMLLALFLASPFRRRAALWAKHLAVAVTALATVHIVTVMSVSQEAFMLHPVIQKIHPYSAAARALVPKYNIFYEEMGMYLIVLVLWFPYILSIVRGGGERSGRDKHVDGAR